MKHYDLIVVGSGAGNIVLDAALEQNQRCALVERDHFGGTCLNRGCIPTKVLVTAASVLSSSEHWDLMGVQHEGLVANWSRIRERVLAKLQERHELRSYYESRGVDCYQATARFSGPKELDLVDAEGQVCGRISAERIVLATGAHTRIPQIEGLDQVPYWTSERFFEEVPETLPRDVILIGGGVISCEFAHFLSAFGCQVHIVQRNLRLLPKAEAQLAEQLAEILQARGVQIHFQQNSKAVWEREGRIHLLLEHRESKEQQELEADMLFLAPGVIPNSDNLNLQAAGLKAAEDASLPVNECLETGQPGIYALGDLIGGAKLRHKANNEAELLAHNLYGEGAAPNGVWRRQAYLHIPQVVFSEPELAWVGLTEAEARKRYPRLSLAERRYSENAKGYALGYEAGQVDDGRVKFLIDDETGRIVGLHILGPEASLLLQAYVYLLHAAPHEIPVLHPEIQASPDCLRARSLAEQQLRPLPDSVANIQQSMTAHPSLAEVSAWAFEHRRKIQD